MNPNVIRRIATVVVGLVGIGGSAYGADQHRKRKQEQAANRARLQEIEDDLASKEEQLSSLQALLGNKNEQVQILASEIDCLRQVADEMRRSA